MTLEATVENCDKISLLSQKEIVGLKISLRKIPKKGKGDKKERWFTEYAIMEFQLKKESCQLAE